MLKKISFILIFISSFSLVKAQMHPLIESADMNKINTIRDFIKKEGLINNWLKSNVSTLIKDIKEYDKITIKDKIIENKIETASIVILTYVFIYNNFTDFLENDDDNKKIIKEYIRSLNWDKEINDLSPQTKTKLDEIVEKNIIYIILSEPDDNSSDKILNEKKKKLDEYLDITIKSINSFKVCVLLTKRLCIKP